MRVSVDEQIDEERAMMSWLADDVLMNHFSHIFADMGPCLVMPLCT